MNYENAFKKLVRNVECLNRAYKLSKGNEEDEYFARMRSVVYSQFSFGKALGLEMHIMYNTDKERNLFIASISMNEYTKTF